VKPEVFVEKLDQAAGSVTLKPTSFSDTATLLESIVLSSEDAIITKTLDGMVTSWNPAASRIFGYAAEEMIGQSILRLIPEALHPEEKDIIAKLKAGQRIEHYETVRVRKDGREITVSLTISPLKNRHGQVIGASKIARDTSERTLIERARFQLAAIVESSEDAILSKDLNGTITSWNKAAGRLFGYTEDEIVGSSILRLVPGDLHGEEREILARLRRGERIEHFETTRVRKNGEPFAVSLTISPVKDGTGKVIGASKILRDISERRKMEQSLIQAEKFAATGRMAASIAHEINNPLEALLNLIFLARENADNADEVRTFLSAAENEVERVSHIAKQTLGYYREQASATRVSVCELMREALHFYEPKLNACGIRICREFEGDYTVALKRGEMMQVLSNLIANSVHAMPDGGVLKAAIHPGSRTLASGTRAHGVVLDIEDNGLGIPEENRQRVFEPFFTTRGSVGTGIGLWVARQFVEGHGGSIELRTSVDPSDHGTCMSIFLPFDTTYASDLKLRNASANPQVN
jgi:PAS domain S-box-containing protein